MHNLNWNSEMEYLIRLREKKKTEYQSDYVERKEIFRIIFDQWKIASFSMIKVHIDV